MRYKIQYLGTRIIYERCPHKRLDGLSKHCRAVTARKCIETELKARLTSVTKMEVTAVSAVSVVENVHAREEQLSKSSKSISDFRWKGFDVCQLSLPPSSHEPRVPSRDDNMELLKILLNLK